MNISCKLRKLLTILCLAGLVSAYGDTFDERKAYILDFYSHATPNARYWGDADVKTAMGYVLARLELNQDTDRAWDMLRRMQEEDDFDMFDCHGNIDAYFRFGDRYPEELKDLVRQRMTQFDYTQNGSTENHKLMFKTAGYLTAVAFPDWAQASATREHCRATLYHMMDNMVRYGLKEFDSSTYGTFYITCMLSLYDHADEPEMRTRAQMTLEWLLVNFASEWLDGYFIASTLREYEFAVSPKLETSYSIIGWLLFGGGPRPALEQHFDGKEIIVNNEGFFAPLAALTSYRVPDIIGHIARDRAQAYVNYESHDMNPASQLNYPWGFRKYTYINRSYGLTSHWDGTSLGWSAQMRRWKLTWKSDAPASTFFMTHPCYYMGSGERLMVARNNYYWTANLKEMDFIANGETIRIRKVRRTYELYGFRFADVIASFPDYDLELELKILLDTLQSDTPALSKEQNDRLFYAVLEDYADVPTKAGKIKKMKTDPHYNVLQVKYAYAMTCHKAQGGQWTNVFLDFGYITEEMLGEEFYRWLYTAFTRATQRLYLVNLPKEFQEEE